MYILLRFSPAISSIFSFILLYLLATKSPLLLRFLNLEAFTLQSIITILLVILFVFLATVIFIGAGHSFKSRLRFFPFLLFTWLSGYSILLYSDTPSILWVLIFLLPLMSWIWLESLYLFWQRSLEYQAYTLERIATYLYNITVFLVASSVIGLQVLLQLPIWITTVTIVLTFFILVQDLFHLYKLNSREVLIYALLGSVLIFELAFVLNLLPTHFFMYGLSIALFYYLWCGIINQVLRRKSRKLVVTSYLIVTSIGACLGVISSLFIR